MPGFEWMGNEEFAEIQEIFEKSRILFRHSFDQQRNGIFKVRDFEQAFAKRMGVSHALAVTSCTAAVRVILAAIGVQPGDEVIMPSFTFVATAESILEAGAVPVVAEIDETLNIDPKDVERKIGEKTKAIVAVHMLGTPARMKELLALGKKHKVKIIEDSAWGCGGFLGNKPLGAIGDIGAFSFDYAKTMTTGEGGMIITNDKALYDRAAAFHDHGHENNPNFPRWEDTRSGPGFNYRMCELQGAVGLAQLRKLDRIVAGQRESQRRLREAIADLPGITWRSEPEGSNGTADALVFFVADNATARRCRQSLIEEGCGTKILPEAITWHFAGTWTHMPKLVAANGGNLQKAFPRSSALLARSVALPVVIMMEDDRPARVRRALERCLK